ncbi:hypothetical protein K7I13_10705 [Brucepastera parasyntrophica]|uniref:hypothetical protein n=1 Tax=Brucepastera parasyntrophica TaxID=2880008 RepID=UPI00210D12D3|nr:hypothetical protein [Brucepastera parasyntrophica]ULQ58982.1 hypothetical protein K7I13_10705 [Brucepastera parasyntrophica]
MVSGTGFIILLVFLGILLFIFAFSLFLSFRKPSGRKKQAKKAAPPPGKQICPVCGSRLAQGEQIKSAVFPGGSDRLCHIFGCTHCYPYNEEHLERNCPVCRKKLAPEEYVFARLFERPDRRNHVHIIGCASCRLSGK